MSDTLITEEMVEKAAKVEWELSAGLEWEKLGDVQREHFRHAMRAALEAVEGDITEVFGTAGHGAGEWREIAEWDWVMCPDDDDVLHAVATVENDADEEWYGDGRTACGRRGRMFIPGLFSRMATERCPDCCAATGMPQGKQSPKNVDECRPVVEARIAALKEKT